MRKILLTTLAVTSTLMMGCGGSAKIAGKDGAAQAVHALTTPSQTGANRATTVLDLTDASATCPKGGTAKLSGFNNQIDISGSGASATLTFTMVLTNCGLATSDQGDALYNGTVTVAQKVITNASGVQVAQAFKGNLTIGGAFNDSLDVDVTESVNVLDMGKIGSVSVVLKGSVKTSSSTYTYDESVNVLAGSISISSK